jgi:transposase
VTTEERLFDEVLRPIADSFYDGCKALADVSDTADPSVPVALMARLSALQECGDRIAKALEVAEPLWDDMRGLAGLPW